MASESKEIKVVPVTTTEVATTSVAMASHTTTSSIPTISSPRSAHSSSATSTADIFENKARGFFSPDPIKNNSLPNNELTKRFEVKLEEKKSHNFSDSSIPNIERPVLYFIDRSIKKGHGEENLNQVIEDILQVNEFPIAILHGLGGAGKTQAALGYARKYLARYSQNMFQFNAETSETFDASLHHCAKKMGVNISKVEIGVIEELIKNKIKLLDGTTCLLLFDNLNNKKIRDERVVNFAKDLAIKGHHIIITSTLSDWDAEGWSKNCIHLKEFTDEEAEGFIFKALQDKLDPAVLYDETKKSIKELILAVGKLPLALSQAVGSIRRRPGIAQYIIQFKASWERRKTLLNESPIFQKNGHKKSVYVTWLTNISNLEEESVFAGKLIRFLAFFDANDISQEHLLSPFIEKEVYEVNGIVGIISSYSLVNVDYTSGNLSIHRLLQEVIQIDLRHKSEYETFLDEILKCAISIFHYNIRKISTYKRAKINILHIKKIMEHAKAIRKFKQKAYELLEAIAMCELEILGQINYAISDFSEICQYYSDEIQDHAGQIRALKNLARCYLFKNDEFEGATSTCEKLMKLTSDPLINAEVGIYSGIISQGQGRYEEAIVKFKENVETLRASAETDPLVLAHALSFYAITLRRYKRNCLPAALKMFEEARSIYKRVLWEDHPEVASQEDNLANTYDDLGLFEKALEFHEKVLNKKKGEFSHPISIAITKYNLAITLIALKKIPRAAEMLGNALEIIDSNSHIYQYAKKLRYYAHLVKFYIDDNNNQKTAALDCLKDVLDSINIGLLQSSSFRNEISWSKEWNDLCVVNDGDTDYYAKLVDSFGKIYGFNHPEVANCHRRLGLAYKNAGKFPQTLKCFQEALVILDDVGEYKENRNYKKLLSEIDDIKTLLNTHGPLTPSGIGVTAGRIIYIDIPAAELKYDASKDKIGGGAYGVVYKGLWKGQQVAIKVINPENDAEAITLKEECLMMLRLAIPTGDRDKAVQGINRIVKILGCSQGQPFHLVMELASHGSLRDLLDNGRLLNSEQQCDLAADISLGLSFLHSQRVQHRDVKSKNVLLDCIAGKLQAKLCDFGFSKWKEKLESLSHGEVGSKAWEAPEVLLGESFSFSADIYSFGVVLWEIVTGRRPTLTIDRVILERDFSAKQNGVRNYPIPTSPRKLTSLIPYCCHMDPEQRPTAASIAEYLGSAAEEFKPESKTMTPPINTGTHGLTPEQPTSSNSTFEDCPSPPRAPSLLAGVASVIAKLGMFPAAPAVAESIPASNNSTAIAVAVIQQAEKK
jgi:serine/threonine protein kinase